jgi:3-oxoacyl-[acyl-carrier protein] reductase
MLLRDKVAIVTGGSKGMGRGIAVRFAAEGCAVVVADIDKKMADETIVEVSGTGQKGLAIECDITKNDQVKATVEKTLNAFGKVDILVNNAGGLGSAPPIEEMTEEEWDRVINLNLKGVFLFSKYVIAQMKERRYGKIINISTIGAIQPPQHSLHYHTAKAGVIGFTLDLANVVARFNINVNVILPGPIKTHFYDPFTRNMTEEQKEGLFRFLSTKVPLQRVGMPEDIAQAALFLASDASSFITGQQLNVAGGVPLLPGGENLV